MTSTFVYPPDRKECMAPCGPKDKRFEVYEGRLIFAPARDVRFPYIYEVDSHPLVRNRPLIKRIWGFVQDTSAEAISRNARFADGLKVPLGPDAMIAEAGLLEVGDGTIVFVRPMVDEPRLQNPLEDVILGWDVDGRRLLDQETIDEIEKSQDEILGTSDTMGAGKPRMVDGALVGGTAFERMNNVPGVKGGRCYSLTCTHQRSRNLIGPTAGGKVYGNALGPSQLMRQRIVKAYAKASMMSLKAFAPQSFIDILEENAEINNHPRVGVQENIAYPALQLNLASAVSRDECTQKGLQAEMGEFGSEEGHIDGYNSLAGLTSMASNSRCPEGYEPGRLHLLGYGLYFRLTPLNFMSFTGLVKHGGTPLIAPPGKQPVPWACRHIVVVYCPESMLGPAGSIVTPMGSLPDGSLFKLGPEITSYNVLQKQQRTNEANWAQDGEVLMEPRSHFNFYVRLMLQLSSYLAQQLPPSLGIEIDPDLFLSSFSMRRGANGERERALPWAGAPDGTAADEWPPLESVVDFSMDVDDGGAVESETTRFLRRFQAIRRRASERGVNAMALRREQALCWIDYLEYRSKFINGKHPNFEALRASVLEGPSAVREPKKRKADDTIKRPDKEPKRLRTRSSQQRSDSDSTAAIAKHIGRRTHESLHRADKSATVSESISTANTSTSHRYETRSSVQLTDTATQGCNGPPTAKASTNHRYETRSLNSTIQSSTQRLRLIPEVVITQRPPRVAPRDSAAVGKSTTNKSSDSRMAPTSLVSMDRDKSCVHDSDLPGPHEIEEVPESDQDAMDDSSDFEDSDDFSGSSGVKDIKAYAITSLLDGSHIRSLQKKEVAAPDDESHIRGILAQLNMDALVDPVSEFGWALEHSKSLPSGHDLVRASKLCASILQHMEEKPTSLETALLIPQLWTNIPLLEQQAEKTATDLRLGRAFIMETRWRAFRWITDVISSVIHTSRRQTWLERLVWDIKRYYESTAHSHRRQPSRILYSNDYLPRLAMPRDYEVTWARYSYEEHEQSRYLFKHVSAALSRWLDFPSDKASVAQCAIVDEMLSAFGYGILVVDMTWKLFSNPYAIVNRGKVNRYISESQITANICRFRSQLKNHPLANPSTKESETLAHLTSLLHRYTRSISDSGTAAKVIPQNSSLTDSRHSYNEEVPPQNTDTVSSSASFYAMPVAFLEHQMTKFVNYLRELIPIVQGQVNTADRVHTEISRKKDFYLPFRQQAPTMQKAMSTILSSTDRLKTRAGLFNVLAFRGVFYGSEYALNDLRWFDNHEAWVHYYSSSSKSDEYFVNPRAYGRAIRGRNLSQLKVYWDASVDWEKDLASMSDVTKLFDYLLSSKGNGKKRFPCIGSLSALLICGDLIYGGLFPQPDATSWATLIYRVRKGAIAQLHDLRLVKANPSVQEVRNAVTTLHEFVSRTLTDAEKSITGYDLIVLEHCLCKFKRYRRLRGQI